jgi:hypothetical protein
VACPVTIEGSYHSATIRKVRGALIGVITRAVINGNNPPCEGGRATILQETLPWHITYDEFMGMLPNINRFSSDVRGIAVRFAVVILGFSNICLYKDQGRPEENVAQLVFRDIETGEVYLRNFWSGYFISLTAGGGSLCPRRLAFSGEANVYVLGSSTTRITLTLI